MLPGGVLAALPRTDAVTVVHDGPRTVLAFGAEDAVIAPADPFATLDAITGGWWAGYAAYELGRAVERVAPRRPGAEATPIPPSAFVRFAARLELDTDGTAAWFGHGAARRALERAVANPVGTVARRPQTSDWTSSLDRGEYEHRVLAIQELIRAGECYQVNLTRRLTGPPLDAVVLWRALAIGNPAPHAMFWRPPAPGSGAPTVVSASPECFLRVDGDTVETRPIKGTATDASQLRMSEKDRAENVMIVDLARNDLGRVCRPGTISVPDLCGVEHHPGLVHLVSTVRGTRRADLGLGGLLRATFPPASITGAPKPRVMQAIEDLEPVARGVYCGATGWFDAECRRADLAVAIRTFTCSDATTTFGVGAGITIDSDPSGEWAETELKAARLLGLAGARTAPAVRADEPVGAHR